MHRKKPKKDNQILLSEWDWKRTENIFTYPSWVLLSLWDEHSTFVMKKSITKEQNGGKMLNLPARGPTQKLTYKWQLKLCQKFLNFKEE